MTVLPTRSLLVWGVVVVLAQAQPTRAFIVLDLGWTSARPRWILGRLPNGNTFKGPEASAHPCPATDG